MAFLTLVWQGPALLGPRGLLPIDSYLADAAAEAGSRGAGFWQLPSLFWFGAGDGGLRVVGLIGAVLSAAVLAGYANAIVLALLCALQISICNVGQTFYGFGWELQLVETGFLCIFLCPLFDARPFTRRPPPRAVIWLLRWLAMRIMWGAGLIKLRGDSCWRDLTCLDFHFETQPVPSPLSPYFHALPHWAHAVGVAFNHLVELGAPFLILGPRRAAARRRPLMVALQMILIASGNLAFLNWLTLVPILACFDDGLWRRILPAALVARADAASAEAAPSRAQGLTVAVLAVGDRVAQRGAGPQHALRLADHEHVVHAVRDRQQLRRVRERRPRAPAAGVRRDHGRDDHARDEMVALRVQVSAGRSGAAPLLDEPVPLPARLAALVRGDGEPARLPLCAAPRVGAAGRRAAARSGSSPTIRSTARPPAMSASSSTATRSRRSVRRSGGNARASDRGCRRSSRDDLDLQNYLRAEGWLKEGPLKDDRPQIRP